MSERIPSEDLTREMKKINLEEQVISPDEEVDKARKLHRNPNTGVYRRIRKDDVTLPLMISKMRKISKRSWNASRPDSMKIEKISRPGALTIQIRRRRFVKLYTKANGIGWSRSHYSSKIRLRIRIMNLPKEMTKPHHRVLLTTRNPRAFAQQ